MGTRRFRERLRGLATLRRPPGPRPRPVGTSPLPRPPSHVPSPTSPLPRPPSHVPSPTSPSHVPLPHPPSHVPSPRCQGIGWLLGWRMAVCDARAGRQEGCELGRQVDYVRRRPSADCAVGRAFAGATVVRAWGDREGGGRHKRMGGGGRGMQAGSAGEAKVFRACRPGRLGRSRLAR
jgi:hypothetical protein